MYTLFNQKHGKEMITVLPGERLASENDIIIATVLGSCVSIVLIDSSLGIGGLNHFMLPGDRDDFHSLGTSGKYGVHALPLLIEDMESLGARRNHLRAKIFGGGKVLQNIPGNRAWTPDDNIAFAEAALAGHDIPIAAYDVGGDYGRKILFFVKEGKVMVKKLAREVMTPVIAEETNIIREIAGGQKHP
jgi:chemotaxis protein CheD